MRQAPAELRLRGGLERSLRTGHRGSARMPTTLAQVSEGMSRDRTSIGPVASSSASPSSDGPPGRGRRVGAGVAGTPFGVAPRVPYRLVRAAESASVVEASGAGHHPHAVGRGDGGRDLAALGDGNGGTMTLARSSVRHIHGGTSHPGGRASMKEFTAPALANAITNDLRRSRHRPRRHSVEGSPFVRGTIERTPRTLKCYVECQFVESFAVQWLQCNNGMGASARHAVSADLFPRTIVDSAAVFRAIGVRGGSIRPARDGADRRRRAQPTGRHRCRRASTEPTARVGAPETFGESEAKPEARSGMTRRRSFGARPGRSGSLEEIRRGAPVAIGRNEGGSPAENKKSRGDPRLS